MERAAHVAREDTCCIVKVLRCNPRSFRVWVYYQAVVESRCALLLRPSRIQAAQIQYSALAV